MADHLIRKGATYYYRRRVPADLIATYKRPEYVLSLRTKDRREAERLVRKVDVEVDELFERLRHPQPSDDMGVRMTPQYDPDTDTWSDKPANTTPQYDPLTGKWVAVRIPTAAEAEEQARIQAECEEEAFRNSAQDDAEQEAWEAKQARKALKRERLLADVANIVRSVIGATLQHSPAAPPVKPHLTKPATKSTQPASAPEKRTLTPTGGKSMHAIMRLWANEKRPVPRTVETAERALNRFRDLMGDIEVPAVTKAHIVDFKDKLVAEGHSVNTVNKTLNYMGIMFNHAIGQAWIDTDPAKGVRIAVKKKPKGSGRVPFSEAALNGIFSHPIYTEGSRPQLGAGEAAYWLPLLGLYTGARIEELCQLAPKDIKQEKYRDSKGREQTAWVMHITGTGEGQGVKNTGSDRRIPIHAELQKLGFIKYAQTQKGKRIFPLLRADKAGYEAPRWSVWWHKEMRKAGAITGRNMVFHSLRHSFKDICRECGISKELADAIQGHSEGDSSGDYGAALYPLAPMVQALNKYKVHGVKLPS